MFIRFGKWRKPFGISFFIVALVLSVAQFAVAPTSESAPSAQSGADLTRLPLGDNKVSTEPRVGYIWSCQTQFNGGGAFANGFWLNGDGTWDSTAKLVVEGEIHWDNYVFSIEVIDGERVLVGNGIPEHPTGIFPIQTSDAAYQFDRNPNRISEQAIRVVLPLNPSLADEPSCIGGTVGIALSGIPIYNGFDAQGLDAVAHEIQDNCGGHPQQQGQYHYHSLSPCLETYTEGEEHSDLMGYALDGFGIYGYRGEDGVLLTNADLDECHGHTHAIEWEGELVEMYHYHATAEFPYTVSCFRGTAVRGLGGGQPQDGNPPADDQPNGQPPNDQRGTPPPPPPPRRQ